MKNIINEIEKNAEDMVHSLNNDGSKMSDYDRGYDEGYIAALKWVHDQLNKTKKIPSRLHYELMDNDELAFEISKQANLSRYDYDVFLDDIHNLRGDEWWCVVNCPDYGIDPKLIAEFKKRFDCEDEEEEN